jgi:hypothetical protein
VLPTRSGVEPDRPGLDRVDLQVRLAPRIARQHGAYGALRFGLDGACHAALVSEGPTEDNEAGVHEAIHERRIFGPAGLLLECPRGVPPPDRLSVTRTIGTPVVERSPHPASRIRADFVRPASRERAVRRRSLLVVEMDLRATHDVRNVLGFRNTPRRGRHHREGEP